MKIKEEWFDWNDKFHVESKIQDKPQQDESKIIKYLKSGIPTATSMSIITDLFDDKKRVSTTAYTDTEWHWHDTLIYYVENYHYKISDDFIEHMRLNNWKVPKALKS